MKYSDEDIESIKSIISDVLQDQDLDFDIDVFNFTIQSPLAVQVRIHYDTVAMRVRSSLLNFKYNQAIQRICKLTGLQFSSTQELSSSLLVVFIGSPIKESWDAVAKTSKSKHPERNPIFNMISDVLSDRDLESIKIDKIGKIWTVFIPINSNKEFTTPFINILNYHIRRGTLEHLKIKEFANNDPTIQRICKLTGLKFNELFQFHHNIVIEFRIPHHGRKLTEQFENCKMKYIKEFFEFVGSSDDYPHIIETIKDILDDSELDFVIDLEEFVVWFPVKSTENKQFVDPFVSMWRSVFHLAFITPEKSKGIGYDKELYSFGNSNPIVSRICKLTGLVFEKFFCNNTYLCICFKWDFSKSN